MADSVWINSLYAKLTPKPVMTDGWDVPACQTCSKPSKCCDYQPFVPNFAIGALIQEGLWPSVVSQHHLTPLGLIPSKAFREKREGVCGFFGSKGECLIWKYRPAECSSFTCGSENYASFSNELFSLEMGLAQMGLVFAGFDNAEISKWVDFYNDPHDGVVESPTSIENLQAVYHKTWAWAKTLEREQVAKWLKM